MQVTSTLERMALAIPEARLEHDLSQRQLAAFSGVSATSIRKLERGGDIDPRLLIRLAVTVVVLDAYRPPALEGTRSLLDSLRPQLQFTDEWEKAVA